MGVYLLQAAIAAVHDEATRAEDTDWPQIVALYGVLMRMSDNPMVALNHAVAVAMARGPADGLALLEKLDDPRPATTASMPCAPTSSRWPATPARPWRTTAPRRAARPAFPSSTT